MSEYCPGRMVTHESELEPTVLHERYGVMLEDVIFIRDCWLCGMTSFDIGRIVFEDIPNGELSDADAVRCTALVHDCGCGFETVIEDGRGAGNAAPEGTGGTGGGIAAPVPQPSSPARVMPIG